jgi:hypothetical protein
MGIDKGSTNAAVIYFDSVYGVHYPGVSGQQGGGNQVHLTYEIQATPTLIVITPDHVIAVKQIFPPSTSQVVDSILNVGGLLQDCMTGLILNETEKDFIIFPNPTSGQANINLNLKARKEFEVVLFDPMGLMVLKLPPQLYHEGRQSIPLNLEGLPKGLYFVRIIENGKLLMTKKLVLS